MIRVRDISIAPGDGEARLYALTGQRLGVSEDVIQSLKISRKSVDARKKRDVRLIYTVDVSLSGGVPNMSAAGVSEASDTEYTPPTCAAMPDKRPVVVGFGPAGMFAALVLAEAGLCPIVLERGGDVDARAGAVARFRLTGTLDPECNVQFGEGGAGTFSDGKLNTGTGDMRIDWVLRRLNEFGAPECILYDARPHVGTDILPGVVKRLRERVIELGGEVRFGTKLTGLVSSGGVLEAVEALGDIGPMRLDCGALILAAGHSARDTFAMLLNSGVALEPKPFSMGVRIEHRQRDIDVTQYGPFAEHPDLPPADYRLNCRLPDGTSAYTFCMCPGGEVIAAASEPGGVVTNGMSNFRRDGENANSALLVTLCTSDFPDRSPLGGMLWQRELEQHAFEAAGERYFAPAQTVGSFLGLRGGGKKVTPSYRPGVAVCDIKAVLPPRLTDVIERALPLLDRKLSGFASPGAVMTAPETRSSSPVRVLRGPDRQSVSLKGLYPCGEGAGYAGGIVSAAVDGIRCAEALLLRED